MTRPKTNRLETNKATTFGLLLAALLMRSLPATKPAHSKTFTVDHTSDGGHAARDPRRRTRQGWLLGTLLAAFVGTLVVAGPVFAVPGDLDTTFDADGKVTTPFGSVNNEAKALAVQPDGKLVVAGFFFNGTKSDFALARYNPDGSLDTTFSGDGKLTTDFGFSERANALGVQPDGKIVAAGFSNSSISDFALARYNSNGALDTTFDTDGKLTTDFTSGSFDRANALAVQSNGKIVAAGSTNSDFALARYNANGTLDTTFDADGKVTTDLGNATGFGGSPRARHPV